MGADLRKLLLALLCLCDVEGENAERNVWCDFRFMVLLILFVGDIKGTYENMVLIGFGKYLKSKCRLRRFA
jgi:hypothetical protein